MLKIKNVGFTRNETERLDRFLGYELEARSDGNLLERTADTADLHTGAITRLIEILAKKKVLSAQDIISILGLPSNPEAVLEEVP